MYHVPWIIQIINVHLKSPRVPSFFGPLVIHLKPQLYHLSRDHPTTARRPVGFCFGTKSPNSLDFSPSLITHTST